MSLLLPNFHCHTVGSTDLRPKSAATKGSPMSSLTDVDPPARPRPELSTPRALLHLLGSGFSTFPNFTQRIGIGPAPLPQTMAEPS